MNLTLADYKAFGIKEKSIKPLLPFLNKYMEWANINTVNRVTSFLATLFHESADLFYMEEIADGNAYEGRIDLGNTVAGYGKKYKGRGPIQLTGYKNYVDFTRWAERHFGIKIDFAKEPQQVIKPEYAVLSAIYFWTVNGLQIHADKDDFKAIQAIVNTGSVKNIAKVNHMPERIAKYDKVKKWINGIIAKTVKDIK